MRSELIGIVQLKAYLRQLAQQEKLSTLDYRALNGQLDSTAYGLVDGLSTEQLPDLIELLKSLNPELDFSALTPLYLQPTRNTLIALREKGLAEAAVLDRRRWIDADAALFGDTKGTIYRIPLEPFSWAKKSRQFCQILSALESGECDLTELYPLVEAFFDSSSGPKRFCGLPEFADNLERELFAAGVGQKAQKNAYRTDLYEVRKYLRDSEAQMRLMFNCGEVVINHPFQGHQQMLDLLKKELVLPRPSIALAQLIMLWQGPGHHPLCRQLFASEQSAPAKALLLVRSGIDIDAPGGQAALAKWCDSGDELEFTEYQQLLELIEAHKLLFDVLQLAAASGISASPAEQQMRWLSVAVELFEQNRTSQPSHTPFHTSLAEQQPEQAFEPVVLPPVFEQIDADMEAQEIAELAAPAPKHSKTDQWVERHSNWNQYVKPFMSENWMGLIGIGFIMVAWAILSMMVWDKSEYYRLAAGALPLLLMSVGGAKISDFFAKLSQRKEDEKAYQKPIQLFCALSTWTVPFNILMAISMFDSGVFTIAFALLGVYGAALWFISPWLSHGFGHSPKKYLFASHGLLLVPTVVQSVMPGSTAAGLALMGYLALVLFLYRLVQVHCDDRTPSDKASSGFILWMSAAHLSLCLAVSHIFYGQMPTVGTLAVFAALVALCLFYIVKNATQLAPQQQAKMTIIGCVATLLSQLLAMGEPLYLLVTLPLCALFWAGHCRLFANNLFAHKKWPAEILAAHFVAYVVALQYLFDFDLYILFALALVATLLLVVIEKRLARHELKLISWGLPVALLAGAYFVDGTGALGYGTFALLLVSAGFNYRRSAELGEVLTWFVAVLVLVALPVIELALWQRPMYLALYCAAVAALWAIACGYLQDDNAKQHRCTMLWLLSALASALLLHAAIETAFQLHLMWFCALVLSLVALAVAARNAQSLLPLYIAAALVAVGGFWVKHQLDLVSNSGLGSALAALVLVVLAPIVQQSRYFSPQNSPQRCFSRYFVFHSKQYLRLALEQMSWVLIAVSLIKTIILFVPLSQNFKLGLASICHIAALLLLAVRYQKSSVAALALLPLTVLLAAVGASIDSVYIPVFAVALLLLLHWGMTRLNGDRALHQVLMVPLTMAHQLLKSIFALLSLFAYPLFLETHGPWWVFAAYFVMTLVYIERVFCAAGKGQFAHLNLLHVATVYALVCALGFDWTNYGQWSWYFITLSLGLFVFAYVSDWFSLAVAKTYHDRIQKWLVGVSFMLLILLLRLYDDLPASHEYLNTAVLVMSLLCLHLANRAYQARAGLLLKWLVCCLWVKVYFDNDLYALLGGVFVFLACEGLWHVLSKNPFHLQGIGELNKTPKDKIAQVGAMATLVIVLAHFAGFFGAEIDAVAPYWLWTLVPLTVYFYRQLHWPVLSYVVALLFVYANLFIALSFVQQASQYGLSALNLLSGGLLVSVLGLALANRILRFFGWSSFGESYGGDASVSGAEVAKPATPEQIEVTQ